MERLSILFSYLLILIGSTTADSSAMNGTWRNNAHDVGDIEDDSISPLKSKDTEINPKYLWINVHTRDAAEFEDRSVKNLSYFKKVSDQATSAVHTPNGNIRNTSHSKYIGGHEDIYRSGHQREIVADLSSHDILLDPGLIPARLTRQAEKSDAVEDYVNPASIKDISGNAEFNGDAENGSIDSSRQLADFQNDLGVAEDRYRPQYPYWYQRQFSNLRYQSNDRREPYRNYLRYPVFPGR